MTDPNIKIRVLTRDDIEATREVMYYYLTEEAGCRAVGIDIPCDADLIINICVPDMIDTGLTLGAFDMTTGKMVGIRLTLVKKKSDKLENGLSCFHPKNGGNWKLLVLESIWNYDFWNLNLFEKYGVDEYVMFYGLAVLKEYGQKGIGAQMLRDAIELVRQRGYKIIGTIATNDRSRILFDRLGFENLGTVRVADIKENGYDLIRMGNLGAHQQYFSNNVLKL